MWSSNNKKYIKDNTMKGYNILRPFIETIVRILYRPKVINKSNIPTSGPVILAGTHIDYFDPLLVGMSTKRPVHFIAKKDCHYGKFGFFFRFVGAIPVDRENKNTSSIDKALDVLKKSYVLGIFPEGTRNKPKDLLLPFRFGAVSLAAKSNAVIVPFAITGDYNFFNNNLIICFGEPFMVNDMPLDKANDLLRKKVEDIIKENKGKKKKEVRSKKLH